MIESVTQLRRPLRNSLPLVLGIVAACSDGSTGSGGVPTGSSHVDVLMTDAPADELLSFSATITDLQFVRAGGGTTENLLSGSVPIEMLGLAQDFAWLAGRELPEGTYTAVQVSFAPASYVARQNDGSEVAVVSISDRLTASFVTPLQVGSGGYRRVLVDLDMGNSLQGSTAAPPLVFTPLGSSTDDDGSSPTGIDEIKGVVQSSDEGANALVIDAFVDDEQVVTLGEVRITTTGTTLLLQDDGTVFASLADFFAALVPDSTLLEVHGALVNGSVEATRIEVEDNVGGGGSQNLVKIEGLVLGIGPGTTFDMAIGEVEDGASIVAAAFGGTIPGSIAVSWDGSTVFLLEEHQPTTRATLAIGQEVKVKFPMFTNPPFLASRIEIENEGVEFEGFITSIAGLPSTFVVQLVAHDPAILSGQVTDTSTDVIVDISSSTLFLDTAGNPALTTAQLLTGMKVEPEGSIAGPPGGPTITATKTKVFAGRLDDAKVAGVSPGAGSFITSGGEIDEPFGGDVVPGPLYVMIAPGAIFTGEAVTEGGFFALFPELAANEILVVEVDGIAAGMIDSIVAYEIRARVETL